MPLCLIHITCVWLASLSVHAAVSVSVHISRLNTSQQSVQLFNSDLVTTKLRYFSICTFWHNYQNTNPHLILIILKRRQCSDIISLCYFCRLLLVVLDCDEMKTSASSQQQPLDSEVISVGG